MSTADTDDRVVPGHSFKFTASDAKRPSVRQPDPDPHLHRSGHGMGKPLLKKIGEIADNYAFLAKNLGMKVP